MVAPRPKRPARLLPLIGAITLVASIAVAALILSVKPPADQAEDPLALYQVAKELQANGDNEAALQILQRARQSTDYPRALQQIEELERTVRVAPRLQQVELEAKRGEFEAAHRLLDQVLAEDPTNDTANLLAKLLPELERKSRNDPTQSTSTDAVDPPAIAATHLAHQPASPPKAAPRRQQRAKHRPERRASERTRRSTPRPTPRRTRERAAARHNGSVYVDSAAGATVVVDGIDTDQRTPVMLSLPPGTHTIEIVPLQDTSVRLSKQTTVQSGVITRVRFAWSPESVAHRAPVARQDKIVRSSPPSATSAKASAPERTTYAASATAGKLAQRATDLEKPDVPPPDVPAPPPPPPTPQKPPPKTGRLLVVSDAPGYVFVDGRNTGKVTPATLALSTGAHEIVIVLKRTNQRIRHTVRVKAGKTVRLRLRL